MNILIVPSSTEIAHEIIRSLKDIKGLRVFGANSIAAYSELPCENLTIGVPFIDSGLFIESIQKIVSKNNITHIIPAHDSAAMKLSEYAETLNAKVVSSSFETNSICRSKRQTYETLKNVVRVPNLYLQNFQIQYPVFVKPDIGQGSVGARRVESVTELDITSGDIICELLTGAEYTVDCVTDKDGILIYAKARKRCQTKNGISVETELVYDNTEFELFASKINKKIRFKGAWFFQVKETKDGELCLLEVATRIAGSMITSRFNGINFTELSLLIANDVPVSIFDNNLNVKLYRNLSIQFDTNLSFDTVYTDYDDCLLLNEDSINTELIKFLYSAINLNKKVILITRHAGDLAKSLERFRINNLFDSIIHIQNSTDRKSQYITDKKSIFIDDAYRERKDVSEKLGIPCFSVDMIRGLNCLKN